MKARKLNTEETRIVAAVNSRQHRNINTDAAKVGYTTYNNFVQASVFLAANKVLVGVAKRNPADAANLRIGQALAFRRALAAAPVVY